MSGELCVGGGMEALNKVAEAIIDQPEELDDWTITYDSHQELHIAHPMWFMFPSKPKDQFVKIGGVDRLVYSEMTLRGRKHYVPGPFTTIKAKDGGMRMGFLDGTGQFVEYSSIQCSHNGFTGWTVSYLEKLDSSGRYPHMIWPPHCRIGTKSHTLVDSIRVARCFWERSQFAITNPITKGSNIKCEHFGAVHAEVEDPQDPSTQVNSYFVSLMSDPDTQVGIGGLARGHCLANTANDLAKQFPNPEDFFGRLCLLTDGTADVTGLEFLGDAFVKNATSLGMKTMTCKEWLSA
jgi:nicotinamidase-related amidase